VVRKIAKNNTSGFAGSIEKEGYIDERGVFYKYNRKINSEYRYFNQTSIFTIMQDMKLLIMISCGK